LEEIGEIPVLIPQENVQAEIVAEVQRRRVQARQLRAQADADWAAAKANFEKRLLNIS